MGPFSSIVLWIFLYLRVCRFAIAQSSQTLSQTPDDSALSLPNLLNSTVKVPQPPWIPPEFHMDIGIKRNRPRLNSIAVGVVAVEAMYDLCLATTDEVLTQRTWSDPGYNLNIQIEALAMLYAVWGLQLTVLIITTGGYWQVFEGSILWTDGFELLGHITALSSDSATHNELTGNATGSAPTQSATVTVLDPDPSELAASEPMANVTSSLDNPDDPLTIVLVYNGPSMRNKDVFNIILAIMSMSAEHDNDQKLRNVNLRGSFQMAAELDTAGVSLLVTRHIYELGREIARWMVQNRQFKETDIVLRQGMTVIATGRLFRDERNQAVQLGNMTTGEITTA